MTKEEKLDLYLDKFLASKKDKNKDAIKRVLRNMVREKLKSEDVKSYLDEQLYPDFFIDYYREFKLFVEVENSKVSNTQDTQDSYKELLQEVKEKQEVLTEILNSMCRMLAKINNDVEAFKLAWLGEEE